GQVRRDRQQVSREVFPRAGYQPALTELLALRPNHPEVPARLRGADCVRAV
ncbi:uncharacterized protein METZ01_LOCUS305565, partial [marine metagenome]